MNKILDTNAFKYLYNATHGINIPDKFNKMNFSKNKYVEFCKSSGNILITSETLHEIFLQSLRRTNNINDFIKHYNFMNSFDSRTKKKFKILNTKNGMYFDIESLIDNVNKNKNINITINKLIDIKIKEEFKIIMIFIDILLTTVYWIFFEINGDRVIPNKLNNDIKKSRNYIKKELIALYNKCYKERSIDNNKFEKDLDGIMKIVIEYMLNEINKNSKILGNIEFNDELIIKEKLGVQYLSKFQNKLKQRCKINPKKTMEVSIDEIIEPLIMKGYTTQQGSFIKYIVTKYFKDQRPIRKNDIIDYLILTCVGKNTKQIIGNKTSCEDTNLFNENNTCLITFDKTLYKFSYNENYLYSKSSYNSFLF